MGVGAAVLCAQRPPLEIRVQRWRRGVGRACADGCACDGNHGCQLGRRSHVTSRSLLRTSWRCASCPIDQYLRSQFGKFASARVRRMGGTIIYRRRRVRRMSGLRLRPPQHQQVDRFGAVAERLRRQRCEIRQQRRGAAASCPPVVPPCRHRPPVNSSKFVLS